MARSQSPNSANSQFFICFADARFLDGQYTVWGEVSEGMEHVDDLPKGEPPAKPGRIVKASLRDSGAGPISAAPCRCRQGTRRASGPDRLRYSPSSRPRRYPTTGKRK